MDHSEIKHLPKVDHTPAELDIPSRILLDAADLLERKEWCQRSYGDTDRFCLRAAVIDVGSRKHGLHYDNEIREALRRVDKSIGNGPVCSLAWNDFPGRTKDEVVAKLRSVALGL